jgi:Cu+-exporting ATPase
MNTNTNTNNLAPGALSRSEYASTEKNQTPALPGMETLVAPFKFKATRVGKETALAQIIKLVEDAQGSKPPIQNLGDQVSSVFVPAVIAVATITFLVWYLSGKDLAFSIARMVTVIVFNRVLY